MNALEGRKPNFENLLAVLRGKRPARPTLFELFLNDRLYRRLAPDMFRADDEWHMLQSLVTAFVAAGYDYAGLLGSRFWFDAGDTQHGKTISLNSGTVITDWKSYEQYVWHDPAAYSYDHLGKAAKWMPEGVKLVVRGPGGVLENLIRLLGYDNLCLLLYDEPELVRTVVDNIGTGLVKYYNLVLEYDAVGAIISNDDWGFNTQTMLSPDDMRRYIFPWHQRIVNAAHDAGKPVILHSCGRYDDIMDDLLAMGYDARHSYEDKITPVEDAYEQFVGKMAVLGGLDVDFLCRETPEAITKRALNMLERADSRGGYALGSGNSVPDYVPDESFFAMTRAAALLG